jgi:tetratricopeptide (TPR) repeat protein
MKTNRWIARGQWIGLAGWLAGFLVVGTPREGAAASESRTEAAATAQKPPMDPKASRLTEDGFRELAADNGLEALQLFREAIALEPKNSRVRFGLATALIATKQSQEALDLLLALNQEDPNDYFILNNLAWLYATAPELNLRDGDKAVRFARAALILAPMDHYVWNTLSEAYFVAGQYERALRAAQEALRIGSLKGAPDVKMQDYQKRVEKCRVVLKATSILEE